MEQNKRFNIVKYNLKELERKLDMKNSCKDWMDIRGHRRSVHLMHDLKRLCCDSDYMTNSF